MLLLFIFTYCTFLSVCFFCGDAIQLIWFVRKVSLATKNQEVSSRLYSHQPTLQLVIIGHMEIVSHILLTIELMGGSSGVRMQLRSSKRNGPMH